MNGSFKILGHGNITALAAALFCMAGILVFGLCDARAQDVIPADTRTSTPRILVQERTDIQARAASAHILRTDRGQIALWGVEQPEGLGAIEKLEGRIALDRQIGGFPIQCEFKGQSGIVRTGQCVSYQDIDLGLYMVQQGHVIVDRSVIFGTVFEELYLQAESKARIQRAGLWSALQNEKSNGKDGVPLPGVIIIFLLVVIVVIMSVSTFLVFRGSQRLVELQEESMEIFRKEQRVKAKEKYVIASMLASEIESNTSKIEAYIMIYKEMKDKLNDPQITPKYVESGDIIQKQPALDRNVFDSNTDKMELLSPSLASKIIHFYARIKTKPDYFTLEPDMPREEVKQMVDQVLKNAEQTLSHGQDILSMMESYTFKKRKDDDSEDAEDKPQAGLKLK